LEFYLNETFPIGDDWFLNKWEKTTNKHYRSYSVLYMTMSKKFDTDYPVARHVMDSFTFTEPVSPGSGNSFGDSFSCKKRVGYEEDDLYGICTIQWMNTPLIIPTTIPVIPSPQPAVTSPPMPRPAGTPVVRAVQPEKTPVPETKPEEIHRNVTFYLGSYPSGSRVEIDGMIQDLPTPAYYAAVSGTHHFRLSHKGFADRVFDYPYTSEGARMTT
jgi:hypothetical protein